MKKNKFLKMYSMTSINEKTVSHRVWWLIVYEKYEGYTHTSVKYEACYPEIKSALLDAHEKVQSGRHIIKIYASDYTFDKSCAMDEYSDKKASDFLWCRIFLKELSASHKLVYEARVCDGSFTVIKVIYS